MFNRKAQITNKPDLISVSPVLSHILNKFKSLGARGLIVGGAVRDAITGINPKDIDVEVYNVSPEQLEDILTNIYQEMVNKAKESGVSKIHGGVDAVGKKFGVIKLTDPWGREDYDFSVPRRDSLVGVGHKGFKTEFDSSITPKEAASRRDFTLNAMAYDPLEEGGKLYDFFGGEDDLKNGVLRATSPAFADDPLRVLRGLQFSARFGMDIDDETARMCREIAERLLAAERNPKTEYIPTLSRERVAEEFMKLVTKGKYPGNSLEYLQKTGWIKFFPELNALFGVLQEPDHHPEGDVAEHTKHTVNSAARIADRDGLKGDDRAVLILSAMFHDIAKPDTSAQRLRKDKADDVRAMMERLHAPEEEILNVVRMMKSYNNTNIEDFKNILKKYGVSDSDIEKFLKWTTYGHEEASGPKTSAVLKEIGIKPEIIRRVERLVPQHMAHVLRFDKSKGPGFVRQLAQDLQPASIEELTRLIESDHSGRPPLPEELPEPARRMLEQSRAEGANLRGVKPHELIPGDQIMRFFDGKPGPWIGEVQKGILDRYLKGDIGRGDASEAIYKQLRRTKSFTPIINGNMLGGVPPRERKTVLDLALRAQGTGELTNDNKDQWLTQYMAAHYPITINAARWYSGALKY